LINIKTLRVDVDHSSAMKDNQKIIANYVRKAEEYRAKARATVDPRVKSALEAVAREFIRKARDLDGTVPRLAGIQ
jgi:hypothetical protein